MVGEGVYEEGLAPAPVEDAIDGGLGEGLAGVRGVLGVELGHLGAGEVAEGERAVLDVEGGAGVGGQAALGLDQIVAEISHADEGDGGREAAGSLAEAFAELGEEAHHGRPLDRVHLVEQQDHRAGLEGVGPGGEEAAEAGAAGGLDGPGVGGPLLGRERQEGGAGDGLDPALLSDLDARLLPTALQRDVQRHPALRSELLSQGPHGGGLAGLPGGMDHEVLLLVDQAAKLREPPLRRQHVVLVRATGPGGVEEARAQIHEGLPGSNVARSPGAGQP